MHRGNSNRSGVMCNRKMMIKSISKTYVYLALAATVLLVVFNGSCASEDDLPEQVASEENLIDRIGVSIAPMNFNTTRAEDGTETPGPGKYDENYFDINGLAPYSLDFDENSIIQISQRGTNREPFLNEDDIFDFRYIPGQTDASWGAEDTYNFAGYRQKVPLQWNTIGQAGSWSGGFALYGMYFPVDNKLRSKTDENGRTVYHVMQDQSTLENLRRSDILGAFHSTDKMFERLKFRFFHLMTYVRIRLYVPLYDNEKHTGYREDALQYATLNNVTTDFAIDWNVVRSSDTQGPFVTPLSGEDEIIMYQHPLEEGQTSHPITEIHYNDYFRDGYFDQGIDGDTDKVRVYDFSVIIPKQRGFIGEDGQESTFTSTDFLNFYFRTNSGAITRYYFNDTFKGSGPDNVQNNDLKLNEGGVFQYIQLYVPRVGNQIIYFGANVLPWGHYGSSMLLQPEDEDE